MNIKFFLHKKIDILHFKLSEAISLIEIFVFYGILRSFFLYKIFMNDLAIKISIKRMIYRKMNKTSLNKIKI